MGSPKASNSGLVVSIIGACVSLVALIIAIVIFKRQATQLNRLEDIAVNIGANETIRRRTREFFLLSQSKDIKRCFLPVAFAEEPLPSLDSGDERALDLLSRTLSREGIELDLIERKANKQGLDDSELKEGNNIFVGHPGYNFPLKQFVEILRAPEKESQLPCWFDFKEEGKPETCFIRRQDGQEIQSPSKERFAEAANLSPNETIMLYNTPDFALGDYAIVARLTSTGSSNYVIAGIHGLGTAIAAEFLDRLLTRSQSHMVDPAARLSSSHMRVLFSSSDFIALLKGDLIPKDLQVSKAFIEDLWTLDSTGWKLVTAP